MRSQDDDPGTALLLEAKHRSREFNQAYAGFVAHFQDRVYAYCLKHLGSRQDAEDAEDATQLTFLKVFKNLDRFNKERTKSFQADRWVFTFAANEVRTIRRSRKRNPDPFSLMDSDEDHAENKRALDSAASPEQLEAALRRLKEVDRLALLLNTERGMPINEIAALLGIKEITLRVRLHRARETLHEALQASCGQ